MSLISEKILALTKQLYPTGRAWRLKIGDYFDSLHVGLAVSEAKAYEDAVSILDSTIPDNSNFTIEDARDWERRLGMITNESVSLANRIVAIKRKMNFPGVVPARQSLLWLENQLQGAGFNVFVYENIPALPPESVSIPMVDFTDDFEHGEFDHGEIEHGGGYNNFVANKIDNDFGFELGANLKCTFFIGGNPKGAFANVDVNRELEFRQLILRTKPAQSVAFLFINYV
jgi:hypothetical protein